MPKPQTDAVENVVSWPFRQWSQRRNSYSIKSKDKQSFCGYAVSRNVSWVAKAKASLGCVQAAKVCEVWMYVQSLYISRILLWLSLLGSKTSPTHHWQTKGQWVVQLWGLSVVNRGPAHTSQKLILKPEPGCACVCRLAVDEIIPSKIYTLASWHCFELFYVR